MPDPVAVNAMFARIARRYDLANRLLSGGVDVWWRRRLVAAVRRAHPHDVLDLATGSGDVAFALAGALPGDTRITGMDFCQPMLDEAALKKQQSPRYAGVAFRQGDGLALPLADASFDAVTISFGLRNMADHDRALREMRRVLRPGGRALIIDMRKEASDGEIAEEVGKMRLKRVDAFVTRSALKSLRGRAYTAPDFVRMIGEAGFPAHRIDPGPIGFEISLAN
jgi:demethylmenaquinone methyltransferase/2-methoxy-6-polyprenyl-1,4-benzoquinol methylase